MAKQVGVNDLHKESLQPSQFLEENIRLLPIGRALDIAMGSGRNAVYLAQMGFNVDGIDISTEAANDALALAKEFDVVINIEAVDLEGDYSIKKGYYDVIICFNYLQRSLIPQIKGGLRPGGIIVYETFIVDQATLFGKPKNPDFLLKHNELLDMFLDFRCLRYREGIIENRKAVASIVAEKI
jgi:2-polyprenyl-3-methyl-5-hydroxy-6-metoxy-1,4-benzoquinol methylase